MAMNYTTLVAAKGTAGSIADWYSYRKVEASLPTILEEAQGLIYSILRCREMRTRFQFTLAENEARIALPSRFLDPIAEIVSPSHGIEVRHKTEADVIGRRVYEKTDGTLGADPFTTTNGSSDVTVALTDHGFTQESSFYTTGATAVGGLTISGTFPIKSVTTNTFVIDCSSLGAASSGATGGGSAATYVCSKLQTGYPTIWAVWDETIHFDCALIETCQFQLPYFKAPTLLSASNLTNFLTDRYPQLVRTACLAAVADFAKDYKEQEVQMSKLAALCQRISVENDLMWRGAEIATENP